MRWCSLQTNEHDLQAIMYPIICKYHRLNINNGNKVPVFPGYICNRWQNMIVQTSQTHNHGKIWQQWERLTVSCRRSHASARLHNRSWSANDVKSWWCDMGLVSWRPFPGPLSWFAIKSLQLIWRSATHKWGLRVLDLLLNCRNLIRRPSNSKVHGVNMGPIWGRQDPGGPHVGPVNFAICDIM